MKAKTRHFPITDFGGRGGLNVPFNLSKIVSEPLLGVTSSIWGNHDTKSALVRSKNYIIRIPEG